MADGNSSQGLWAHSGRVASLLDTVKRGGRHMLSVADPIHGNTESTSSGRKTLWFKNTHGELDQAPDIHAAAGTRLDGVLLEFSGKT